METVAEPSEGELDARGSDSSLGMKVDREGIDWKGPDTELTGTATGSTGANRGAPADDRRLRGEPLSSLVRRDLVPESVLSTLTRGETPEALRSASSVCESAKEQAWISE
jgi:hypothetical protein